MKAPTYNTNLNSGKEATTPISSILNSVSAIPSGANTPPRCEESMRGSNMNSKQESQKSSRR